jgi:hypothetical protein
VPATGREPRLARKPYTKPACTPGTSSDLTGRFQALQKLRRSLSGLSGPIVAVDSYSGPLHSLVTAVDEAFHSAPTPVIIVLNSEQLQSQSEKVSDSDLNLWRLSGDPEARDIAAVLTAISSIQLPRQSAPAPFLLRGGTNE